MLTTGRMWQCDLCGWRWMFVEGRMPVQCPSRTCRSRRWNSGDWSYGGVKRLAYPGEREKE
jgi:hypothetical protein